MVHSDADFNEKSLRLDQAIGEYLELLDDGQSVDRAKFISQRSDIADELKEYFESEDEFANLVISEDLKTCDVATDVLNSKTLPYGEQGKNAPLPKLKFREGNSSQFGDYELLEEIARGGMGVVYRARQVSLNREVAIKLILSGEFADQEEIKRFNTEAESAGGLLHRGIVPVYEIGEHDGLYFFSMGYVGGGSLADLIAQGPLTAHRASRLMHEVASAVHFAHQHGVIHRDLKPANILMDTQGLPQVTDFGLAKMTKRDSEVTTTGQVLGTPSYMSPEQAIGANHLIREWSDIYSLGAVLYALLTGTPPFRGKTQVQTLAMVINQEPEAPSKRVPAVPRDLETICLKCLSKNPQLRYASAAEFADDLGRFLIGDPINARPISTFERSWRWVRRHMVVSILGFAVATTMTVGTIVSTYFGLEAQRQATRADNRRKDVESLVESLTTSNELKQDALNLAKENERKAQQFAERAEHNSRIAQRNEKQALWTAYVAQMNPIQQSFDEQNWSRLDYLIDQITPTEGQPDFRGWEFDYLQDLVNRSNREVKLSHTARHHVDWSRNGFAAIALANNAVDIWHPETDSIVATLPPHPGRMYGVIYNPEGDMLAVLHGSRLTIWEIPIRASDLSAVNPVVIHNYERKDDEIRSLGWSPDGSKIAICGKAGIISVRDVNSQVTELTMSANTDDKIISTYYPLSWHPNGKLLAVPNSDQRTRIWNLAQKEVVATHNFKREMLRNGITLPVEWSPTGRLLAMGQSVCDQDGENFRVLGDSVSSPSAIGWSSNDEEVAVASLNNGIAWIHADTGRTIRTLNSTSESIDDIAVSPDDQSIAVVAGGKLRIVSARAFPVASTYSLSGRRHLVTWSRDGNQIAFVSGKSSCGILDAATGQTIKNKELSTIEQKHSAGLVTSIEYSPDGNQICLRTNYGLFLWDITGNEIKQIYDFLPKIGIRGVDARWSPDGKSIAAVFGGGCVVFRAPNWEAIRFDDLPSNIVSLEWDNRGKRLLAGAASGIYMIDVESQNVLYKIKYSTVKREIAWSPDCTMFAAGSISRQIGLFRATDGHQVRLLTGTGGEIQDIAWHPDGRRLASVDESEVLTIWDVATGVSLLQVQGYTLKNLAWSPDGRRLAAGTRDGQIQVFGSPEMPFQSTNRTFFDPEAEIQSTLKDD